MAIAEEALLKQLTDRISACYVDLDGKLDCGEVLTIAVSYFGKLKAKSVSEKKDLLVKLVSAALEKVVPAEQYERAGSKSVLDVLPAVIDILVYKKSWFSCLVPSLSCCSSKSVNSVLASSEPVRVRLPLEPVRLPLELVPVRVKSSAVKVVVKRGSQPLETVDVAVSAPPIPNSLV
jgi:hypothetical protein